MKRDNVTLKTYFETGDYPTEAQFIDLIDSFLNIEENDAVTGITNNGDNTYTFQLLSGGTETLNLQSLPDDIPIANIIGLQAILDMLDPNSFLRKNQDETTSGSLIINMGSLADNKQFTIGAPGTSGYFKMDNNGWTILGNVSPNDGQDSFLAIRRSGELELNDNGTVHTIWHSGNDGSLLRSDTNDTYNGQVLTMGFGNKSRIDFLNNDVANQSLSLEYEAADGSLREGGYALKIKSQNTSPQDDAHLEVEGGVYAAHFSLVNSSTRFTKGPNNSARLTTSSGYIDIGPQNDNFCHITTDRSNFWFNQEIRLNTGVLRSHNGDLNLNRNGSTTARLRITDGTTHSDQNLSVTGGISTTNALTYIKADGASMQITWENNFLRQRRSGAGTVAGWRWDNFDTVSAELSSGGNLMLSGDLIVNGNNAFMADSNARVKWSVWNSLTYGIGMQSGMTMGSLNDFAMTFQMNSDNDRGFWWGDSSHSNSEGAMALTTNGFLTLANHMRVGYGEADTAAVSTSFTIQANGTMQATNFILSSDRRLKENIKDYTPKPILVKWRTFDWIEGDKKQLGVIAQELNETHPEYVVEEENGHLSVKYIDLLIAKMAEKDKQLADLELRLEKLEKLIEKLV